MNAKALLLVPFLLLCAGCGGEGEKEAATEEAASDDASWGATIAFEAGQKLGGCAVGDVDPRHVGNEILAVAASGDVLVVRHDAEGWHGEVVARAGGEMISCAIGDADRDRPGLEAVVGGMLEGGEDSGGKGAAHLLTWTEAGWHLEKILEDEALVHGVCVGDVDTTHDGAEVVCVGFSRKATVLHLDRGEWQTLASVGLRSPGKSVVPTGTGALVACVGGTLDLVAEKDGQWFGEPSPMAFGGPARLDARESRVLVACDDGRLHLLTPDGNAAIHKESEKLRGAVLADLDPSTPGLEAATAGYGKTVTLLVAPAEGETTWTPRTLWRDAEKFHHLAAGELLADGRGLELVAVGYSGRVIVASRR